MNTQPMARERKHTLHFLRGIRDISPVFLDTDIDMTAVRRHREAAGHHSYIAYVLHVAARVMTDHPEANAAVGGRWRLKVARYRSANGKFTMDRTLNGRRIVLSAVLTDLQDASLDDIQRRLDAYRHGDPAVMPEFAAARMLHRLPGPVSGLMFRIGTRPLARRAGTLGTFAVTSLGHAPVDGFYSVGGTTVTLGLGRVADRPVVRDGAVAIAPLMRLSLAFDHRVIDGAEAADVLAAVKAGLEDFPAPDPREAAEPSRGAETTDADAVDAAIGG